MLDVLTSTGVGSHIGAGKIAEAQVARRHEESAVCGLAGRAAHFHGTRAAVAGIQSFGTWSGICGSSDLLAVQRPLVRRAAGRPPRAGTRR